MRRFSLILLAVVALSSSAHADEVVFDNFGPADTFLSTVWSAGPDAGVAMGFTPSGSGSLVKIEAPFLNFMPDEEIPLTLRLTDSLTSPDYLEEFSLSLSPGSHIYSANSVAKPTLLSGAQYWLQAVNPGPFPVGWLQNPVNDAGLIASSLDGGQTWFDSGQFVQRGAFRVTVSPSAVPELSPGIFLLGAIPAGLALRRRRGRNARGSWDCK